MKRKHRRLVFVVVGMAGLAIAAALVLNAFRDSLVFFYSPSEIIAKDLPEGRRLRVGGLVEEGSVRRLDDGLTTEFRVTDLSDTIEVVFKGVLPDLFREGQGVIAEGSLGANGVFVADSVLAKHDEKYMPPEVAEALKKSGQWKGAQAE